MNIEKIKQEIKRKAQSIAALSAIKKAMLAVGFLCGITVLGVAISHCLNTSLTTEYLETESITTKTSETASLANTMSNKSVTTKAQAIKPSKKSPVTTKTQAIDPSKKSHVTDTIPNKTPAESSVTDIIPNKSQANNQQPTTEVLNKPQKTAKENSSNKNIENLIKCGDWCSKQDDDFNFVYNSKIADKNISLSFIATPIDNNTNPADLYLYAHLLIKTYKEKYMSNNKDSIM